MQNSEVEIVIPISLCKQRVPKQTWLVTFSLGSGAASEKLLLNSYRRLYDWGYDVYPQSRTQSLQAFWSAGQRREDSGDIEFYYRRISAVKQWQPLRNSQSKKLNFFDVPRVFPALPRWPKSLKTLRTRLVYPQSYKLCKVNKVKVLFPVLVSVFHLVQF